MSRRPFLVPSFIFVFASFFFSSATARADVELYVGNNTATPIFQFDNHGNFLGTFGPDQASSAAPDGHGNFYVDLPSDTSSAIGLYDSHQNLLSSFNFTSGVDPDPNNPSNAPSWISEIAYGGNGTLWLAGFNGMVYHVDGAGNVMSSFNSTHLRLGLATDGTFLYTTQGVDGGSIDKRDLNGNVVATIHTSFNEGYGIGMDVRDGSFWTCNDNFRFIEHIDNQGVTLGSIDTGIANLHDGIAVVPLSVSVPEPSALILLGLGLAGSWIGRRRCHRGPRP